MTKRNLASVRGDFPIFQGANEGVVYLDSAASSQKPQVVVDRICRYYQEENANVHRGIYRLSERATTAFEESRQAIAKYLGGVDSSEIIFTRGTTESINLVASSWGEAFLEEGDEIVLTVAEHHSNIVPWQILAQKCGAVIKYIPLTDDLRLDLDQAAKLIGPKTKMLACAQVSNVLGVVHPIKKLIEMAKAVGAKTLIDGAQGLPHFEVNLKELDCDFYAFSSHKVLGPTGVGVLYGKAELLNAMPPYHGGGDMIEEVTLAGSTWAGLPSKFEAGTPNIAGVIGLKTAIEYLASIDKEAALAHDRSLGARLITELKSRPGIRLFSKDADDWVGIVTFYHEQIHPHDLASICDGEQVCIRAGHHCAQPLMKFLGVSATSRVSPYIYNAEADIDAFIAALNKAESLFL